MASSSSNHNKILINSDSTFISESKESNDVNLIKFIENPECCNDDVSFSEEFNNDENQEEYFPFESFNMNEENEVALDNDLSTQPQTSGCSRSNLNINESNAIDNLLTKQRIELAIELRKLKFSCNPVTNRESRKRLENFFSRTAQNSSNENVCPTQSVVFRPSFVLNEIAELNSQRRVSNLLNETRSNIERSLQRYVQNSNRSNTIEHNSNLTETIQSSTQLEQSNQNVSNINQNLNSNLIPRPETEASTIRTQINSQPWLATHNTNNLVEEMTREQIISEISELVHMQLVSHTLQSEFRNTLEQRIVDRLRRSGTDGNQTRQFIQELAQNTNSNVQRNDFSHLGINTNSSNRNNELNDLLDSASSYNEQRFQRTVVHNSKEIKELKTEILELKNLLKLSFELQLDMQRSLKQEINALISGTFNNLASTSLINSTRPANEGKCVICTDSQIDTVFYQCGHMCSCYLCSINLKNKGHNCPVCRAPIKDILRTYRSNLD